MSGFFKKYFFFQLGAYLLTFFFLTSLSFYSTLKLPDVQSFAWVTPYRVIWSTWDIFLLTLSLYILAHVAIFCAILALSQVYRPYFQSFKRMCLFGFVINFIFHTTSLFYFIAHMPAFAKIYTLKGVVPLGDRLIDFIPGLHSTQVLSMISIMLWGIVVASLLFIVTKRFPRLTISAAVISIGLAFFIYNSRSPQKKLNSAPNILIIGIDSLRPDRLSFSGYKRQTTPKLDRYFSRSVFFENTYTSIARTTPSMVTILTGTFPRTNRIFTMLPREEERTLKHPTLIDILKKHNYRTSVVSDFAGETFSAIEFGFDRKSAPKVFSASQFLRQEFFSHHVLLPALFWGLPAKYLIPEIYHTAFSSDADLVSAKLEEDVRDFSEEGRPWLAMAYYSNLHYPYSVQWPYYQLFSDQRYDGESKYSFKTGAISEMLKLGKAPPREEIHQVNALYDQALRSMDDSIDKMLQRFQDSGFLKNTIIVFLSDHGEHLFENNRIVSHGSWLDEKEMESRILFALHYPESRRNDMKSRRLQSTARSIDIASTILDLLGFQEKIGEGISLLNNEKYKNLVAVSETDIAFNSSIEWIGTKALTYPHLMKLIEPEDNEEGKIVLKREYLPVVRKAKWRMLRNDKGKLLYIPTRDGGTFRVFGEGDKLRPEFYREIEKEGDLIIGEDLLLSVKES